MLVFESVVAHGATDSAGVASGYIEDGWREYTANGQKKGRAAGFSTWRTALKNPGGALLSHTKSHAVPSAQRSLTSEFGMGSGVASSQ